MTISFGGVLSKAAVDIFLWKSFFYMRLLCFVQKYPFTPVEDRQRIHNNYGKARTDLGMIIDHVFKVKSSRHDLITYLINAQKLC